MNSPLPQLANTPTFEVVDIDKSIAQVAAARPFPPIPTAVLTKTEPFPIPLTAPNGQAATVERVWLAAALNLVALRPQTPHIMVPAATTTSRSTNPTSSQPQPTCSSSGQPRSRTCKATLAAGLRRTATGLSTST